MAPERRELPLFPLRSVLFPGTVIPMNVFEQRYRTMMADVLAGDGHFGIVLIKAGLEVGGPAMPMEVGTIAHVQDLERRPDGGMTFNAVGGSRFRILELLPPQPYLRGNAELLPEDTAEVPSGLVQQVRQAFYAYLEASSGLTGSWLHERCAQADGPALSYLVAFSMEALPPVKQWLLEMQGHQKRLDSELSLLQHETELLKQAPRSARMARFLNLN
ncbi:MAG: hypothetical protein EXR48_00820 [Dehalococcoidia bacterium]|nr:hypothetical protein [Dehalococcoidia bacterium]